MGSSRAGIVAAVLSGAPSTLYALASGRDPAEATLAAGSILLPREQRIGPLLATGLCVHVSLSLGWAAVLDRLLPAPARLRSAAIAGLLIAGLDLGIIGRRFPRIRRLPVLPQLADHVAYALVVAALT
ncbi:MAG: hypothetical protein ACR2KL_10275 [Nocardioidaceae bacterium]